MNDIELIFMTCPYPPELCDAAASLSDLEFPIDEGWKALLTCANGHRFFIGQLPANDDV